MYSSLKQNVNILVIYYC